MGGHAGHAAGGAPRERVTREDRRRLTRARGAARLSVQRWVARYLWARDPRVLADRVRPGRPRVAAVFTPERLAALLATDPRALGYRATTWTAPLLAQHLRSREGVAVSER